MEWILEDGLWGEFEVWTEEGIWQNPATPLAIQVNFGINQWIPHIRLEDAKIQAGGQGNVIAYRNVAYTGNIQGGGRVNLVVAPSDIPLMLRIQAGGRVRNLVATPIQNNDSFYFYYSDALVTDVYERTAYIATQSRSGRK